MNEEQVNGIDTIRELSGEPPKEIHMPYYVMLNQQILMQGWNAVCIAVIPYCYKCKEPLVWHTNPEGNVLFHCPKCNRRWIKSEDWNEQAKRDKKLGKLVGHD